MQDTSITVTTDFDNPTGAIERYNGAVRDFTTAFGKQVLFSGLLTDELSDGSGGDFADERNVNVNTEAGYFANTQTGYPYPDLSLARLEALNAIASIRQYDPSQTDHMAELYDYVGLVELYFAEDMCNGVPLAEYVNGAPQLGPTLTRTELLQRAMADFDSAAVLPDVGSAYSGLAAIAQGRALLDNGEFDSAAAAVASVPSGLIVYAQIGAPTQYNSINQYIATGAGYISDREGENGLDFVSGADPRVPIDTVNGSTATGHAIYLFASDSTTTSPMILTSGVEAGLIVAEAALQRQDVTTWANALNALRASWPDTSLSNHMLPADSTTTASQDLRVSVMFRERAMWLFLTGHRQGDMRRLVRQYGRPVETVFPTGEYQSSGFTYGTDVTFVPFNEQGNSNYTGCVDRLP